MLASQQQVHALAQVTLAVVAPGQPSVAPRDQARALKRTFAD
jgi:hypothetical protein